MQIKDLFQKDIYRPINGVVKADQLDASSVWQELEEFVVTKELHLHLQRFFSIFCQAIDQAEDPDVTGKIGVWVSGFFGSGKSHFIKVLSYLLENKNHTHQSQTKRAVEFFESKIKDAMLLGDIKRVVAFKTDVILFNIDSKADSQAGRDAILKVFLKVLNEMEGYSGDYPHIAHMERYLASKGKLVDFHVAYQALTGTNWSDERDAYIFNRDEVVKSLAQTIGQSEQSCEKWVDGAEDIFPLNIENFCRWVKDYLDAHGHDRRIIFLVDEVGQFIGTDTHLMLNLQTITEELGTICKGRAWVVVTSQEDIDAVLGEIQSPHGTDFSKIQGRFRTRLSLSSANVDEVIQERLLAKREEVRTDLEAEYDRQGDILKNQLSFRNIGTTFPQFKEANDFVQNYPFAPYQFKLLQKIFESVRRAGATGLHLAQGERSLLDAFQHACQSISDMEIGILVPLYRFYPAIESFLDTTVKRTIDQAKENASLEDFDTRILEVLFLIRYVDEIKGNIDNLVTLCLNQIDADRLALHKTVEESLQRLEAETLINRSGDTYFFLTSEERDINREIKNVAVSTAEEARLLGELVFNDVLQDQRKHRFNKNGMDFIFNRFCDGHPVGNRVEGGLIVSIISSLTDDYESYLDGKCVLESSQNDGQILIRLQDDKSLERDLRMHLQTDKYNRTRDNGTLPPTTKRILRDLGEENRIRHEHLANLLGELLKNANYYVAGQRFEVNGSTPQAGLGEAMDYLVQNTFRKMNYLETLRSNPHSEIQAVLQTDNIGQEMLSREMQEDNTQATADIRDYIALCSRSSKQIVLFDMITRRYAHRPYGWPEWEIVLLLARLYMAGGVQFVLGGAVIPKDDLVGNLTTRQKWRSITVVQRVPSKPKDMEKARELGRQVFARMGPEGEERLSEFLKNRLAEWHETLEQHRIRADSGNYPGSQDIMEGLGLLKQLMAPEDSSKFLARFNTYERELLGLTKDMSDLNHFYQHQRPAWDRLSEALSQFQLNHLELEHDDSARLALQRIEEILAAPRPYGMIKEADQLIHTVNEVNEALLSERRTMVLDAIANQTCIVIREIATVGGDEALISTMLAPLEDLVNRIKDSASLAHIGQAEADAIRLRDEALTELEQFLKRKSEHEKATKDIPVLRLRRVVSPSNLVQGIYLESQADVDSFLDRLRKELTAALANNERIEIR